MSEVLKWITIPVVALTVALIALFYNVRKFYFDRSKHRDALSQAEKMRPFLEVAYHRQVSPQKMDSVIVGFQNKGEGPVKFFTAGIKSKKGGFTIGEKIRVTSSGIGGNSTTISGKDLLPQETALVSLQLHDPETTLEPPEIKSDSPYKFVGEVQIRVGE